MQVKVLHKANRSFVFLKVDMGQDSICFCCEKFHLAKCEEETALKLYHAKSCSEARFFFKVLCVHGVTRLL